MNAITKGDLAEAKTYTCAVQYDSHQPHGLVQLKLLHEIEFSNSVPPSHKPPFKCSKPHESHSYCIDLLRCRTFHHYRKFYDDTEDSSEKGRDG